LRHADSGRRSKALSEGPIGPRGFQRGGRLSTFKRVVDEFETYVLEDGYGGKTFRIGSVRLTVDRSRHQALRRLKGQALTTANFMADDLDDLSEFLGPEDQSTIDRIMSRLSETTLPESYRAVMTLAREAISLYSELLDEVGAREAFEQE
jgi:hypothetical protein